MIRGNRMNLRGRSFRECDDFDAMRVTPVPALALGELSLY